MPRSLPEAMVQAGKELDKTPGTLLHGPNKHVRHMRACTRDLPLKSSRVEGGG